MGRLTLIEAKYAIAIMNLANYKSGKPQIKMSSTLCAKHYLLHRLGLCWNQIFR